MSGSSTSAFGFTGTVVEVTVQATGEYDIDAFGAAGGVADEPGAAGAGAEEGGSFVLVAGEELEIVVGEAGAAAANPLGNGAGGGGGGTFVFADTGPGGGFVPLLVAGGGSGALEGDGSGGTVGDPGSGDGGVAYGAGGGAGLYGDGGSAIAGGGNDPADGFGGGAGGAGGGDGGFGGGGGGALGTGGGGGGYTGGESGHGGTSYDAGDPIATQTIADEEGGDGYLIITPAVACFCPGTRIATPIGGVTVEALRAGDVVQLATGDTATLRWVGHRRASETSVVRFRRGSLPIGPTRDLYVSDDHAMFLDGVLVPAGLLVNGSSIVAERRKRVVFFHVELDAHAILLAEGAPAESYMDTGNRRQFGNCPLTYDPISATQDHCAELVVAGERLERIRARLALLLV